MKYKHPRSFSSFGMDDPEVEKPPEKPPIPNDGMRHKQLPDQCMSNFGAMNYDDTCMRCVKISKVVMLKRKTIANGCSEQESALATAKAQVIINQYALTRGDIFDRLYDARAIQQRVVAQKTYHDTYGAANVRNQPWNKTSGPRGGKKINDYFRKPEFMSEY